MLLFEFLWGLGREFANPGLPILFLVQLNLNALLRIFYNLDTAVFFTHGDLLGAVDHLHIDSTAAHILDLDAELPTLKLNGWRGWWWLRGGIEDRPGLP